MLKDKQLILLWQNSLIYAYFCSSMQEQLDTQGNKITKIQVELFPELGNGNENSVGGKKEEEEEESKKKKKDLQNIQDREYWPQWNQDSLGRRGIVHQWS